jgi:vitamin K-dependent gamma-carboxylase
MTEAPAARRFAALEARVFAWLRAPRDLAAIAAFRFAFGALITLSAARFLAYGWVDELLVAPAFRFKYWGWGWVPAASGPLLHAIFIALMVLGALVALGLLYRPALALLTLLFAYVQLVDATNYLNHYYLVVLLGGLLLFIPAHAGFSLDAWLRPGLRRAALPAWCTYLLRFQVGTVYVFAGLAKLNADWLLHAQPLNIWLAARADLPLLGPLLEERWVAYLAAWFGFLFDSTIVLFLLCRRTRPLAYAVVVLFHSATAVLFPIGLFPLIMTLAALVFFDPSWPRRVVRLFVGGAPAFAPADRGAPQAVPAIVTGRARAFLALAGLYLFVQIAFPLRAWAYGGNVLWHEQGMRFSWRVMAREKNGSVEFHVRPRALAPGAPRREWLVSPRTYLTPLQAREMAVQPDLILQMAHAIARDYAAKGLGPVEVRADAQVSLNGRPTAPLIDPDVDLAAVEDGFAPKRWILPVPATAPIHLKPLLARRR